MSETHNPHPSATGLKLAGNLLIATPEIEDGTFFYGALIYVILHSAKGAVGVIVNRPTKSPVAELLAEYSLEDQSPNQALGKSKLHVGGPVGTNQVLIVHEKVSKRDNQPHRSISITGKIEMLKKFCKRRKQSRYLVAVGYAGWGADQLEAEIGNNSWLHVPATPEIVFDTEPERKSAVAAASLGFELESLFSYAGRS